jgi:hypothetical protein
MIFSRINKSAPSASNNSLSIEGSLFQSGRILRHRLIAFRRGDSTYFSGDHCVHPRFEVIEEFREILGRFQALLGIHRHSGRGHIGEDRIHVQHLLLIHVPEVVLFQLLDDGELVAVRRVGVLGVVARRLRV